MVMMPQHQHGQSTLSSPTKANMISLFRPLSRMVIISFVEKSSHFTKLMPLTMSTRHVVRSFIWSVYKRRFLEAVEVPYVPYLDILRTILILFKALPAGVTIPGAYSYSDPGVVFNLCGSFTSYTIPGPAVWDGTSSGYTSSASSSAVVASSLSTVASPSPSVAAVISSTQATVATSSEVVFITFADSVTIATSLAATTEALSSQTVTTSAAVFETSVQVTSAAPVASSTKKACSVKASQTTSETVASPSASSTTATVAKYRQWYVHLPILFSGNID
jgi:hypothetical protein